MGRYRATQEHKQATVHFTPELQKLGWACFAHLSEAPTSSQKRLSIWQLEIARPIQRAGLPAATGGIDNES